MKKLKKTLGLILALAMVLSTAAISPLKTMAADYPELALETFDDWTDIDAEFPASGKGTHEWQRWGAAGSFTGSIDNSESAGNFLTMKSSWSGVGRYFPGAKSGAFKIKASIKADLTSDTDVADMMIGNSAHIIPVMLQGDGTVRTASAVNTDAKTVTDSINNPIGKYTVGEWVDVEVIHNIDNSYMSVKVMQDGKEIAHKYLSNTSALGQFNVLGFKYIGSGSMSIDNVSVEKLATADGVTLFEENFDGTATVDQMKNYLFGMNDTAGTITDGALNIPTSWSYANNRFYTSHGLKGKYTLSFKVKGAGKADIRLDNDKTMPEVPLMALGDGKIWTGEAYFGSFNVNWFTDGAGNASVAPVASYDTDKWIEVTAVIDTVNAVISTKFEQDGTTLAEFPIRGIPGLDDAQGLVWIRYRNLSGGISLDDVKVTYGGEIAGTTVMVDEDFSDFSETSTENRKRGWIDGFQDWGVYGHTVVTEDGNKMLKISTDGTGNTVSYTTNSYIDRGDVTIDFDLKLEGSGPNFLTDLVQSSTESTANFDGTTAIRTIGGTGKVTLQYHSGNGPALEAGFTKGEWYHYTLVVHPKKSVYDIIMTDDTGKLVNEKYDIPMNYGASQSTPQTTFKTVRFRLWNSGDAYIDNFKMTYDIERPKLLKKNISMVDSNGNAISDIINDVDPALQSITLDFGTELSNVTEVTLTSADGVEAKYAGTQDDTKFIMDLNEILKDETKYTLYVAPDVTASNGNKMGEAFTLEFTTAKAVANIALLNVTDTEGEIKAFSDLTAGEVITVNTTAVNKTADDKSLAWIVAYYNGDRMVDCDMQTAEVLTNTALETQPTFTVKSLEGVTNVKVFLWDTLNTMIPYCNEIKF